MAATIENILYFCNVKRVLRHEVAASSSVFCVTNLGKKFNRNDGGSSNALKGLAVHSLTHRIAVFYVKNVLI